MSISSDALNPAVIKTLLLTDLVDSTRLFERLGDERAAEVSAEYDRVAAGFTRQVPRSGDRQDRRLPAALRPSHRCHPLRSFLSVRPGRTFRTARRSRHRPSWCPPRRNLPAGELPRRCGPRRQAAGSRGPGQAHGRACGLTRSGRPDPADSRRLRPGAPRGGWRNRFGTGARMAGPRPLLVQGNRRAPRHLRSRGRRHRSPVGAPEFGKKPGGRCRQATK